MAQGDPFEMGVAVQIKNHSFRFPSWYADVLDGACNASETVQIANATDQAQVLGVGDRIILGPNSSGVCESGIIAAISSPTLDSPNITLTEVTTNNFAIGDHVTGVGTNLGGAWDVGLSGATPGGIATVRGKDDRFCQRIQLAGADDELKQTLDDDEFIADTKFRVGCYYKQSAGNFYLQVHDGNSPFINKICNDTTNAWVAVMDTGTCVNGTISDSYIRFFYKEASTFYVDCVFLEHAHGTDDAADGFYTFTEYPDFGSVSWRRRTGERKQTLLDGTMRGWSIASSLGDSIQKYTLRAHFSHVSQTFFDNLMILKEWQMRGRLLTLHPNIDDLPPVLVGFMSIPDESEMAKDFWDLGKRSFDLTFTEA